MITPSTALFLFVGSCYPLSIQSFSVVLVGASGYLGQEIAHQLVVQGHRVTAVVRNDARREALHAEGNFEVISCDVAGERGAYQLAKICKDAQANYIINTAAIFKRYFEDSEAELVLPTLRIAKNLIKACRDCGTVERLVHTSSMAAVRDARQKPAFGKAYTTADFNSLSRRDGSWPQPYQFSKAESERLIWALTEKEQFDTITICPSMIFGPPRSRASASSVSVTDMTAWLCGEKKIESRLICDVRDVATAHIKALNATVPCSTKDCDFAGRYIVSPEARVAASDIANALRADSKLAAHFPLDLMTADTTFSPAIPIGDRELDAEKTSSDLGVVCRSPIVTAVDMAHAIMAFTQGSP